MRFGGALAMTLSFGGALMPVHVEDYENAVSRRIQQSEASSVYAGTFPKPEGPTEH